MKRKAFESRYASPSASPGFVLWKVANLHQRLQRQALDAFDLSPTQFSLLACYRFLAFKKAGPISQAEVCDYASLDKMLVSDATRSLLKKKLITRTRSETDARAFAIALTPSGSAICAQSLRAVEAVDAQFFAKTGDVAAFMELTAKLLANSEAEPL